MSNPSKINVLFVAGFGPIVQDQLARSFMLKPWACHLKEDRAAIFTRKMLTA